MKSSEKKHKEMLDTANKQLDKEFAYIKTIEKDLKKANFDLSRLRKKQLNFDKNLQESKEIFKNVLSVKLQYEELISILCHDKEIKVMIQDILSDLDKRKKLKEKKVSKNVSPKRNQNQGTNDK